jgi:hypothetical protein
MMDRDEREKVRGALVVINAIELNVVRKINKIIQFLNPYRTPDLDVIKSLSEVKTMLADIPARKKTIIDMLDRQAEEEERKGK